MGRVARRVGPERPHARRAGPGRTAARASGPPLMAQRKFSPGREHTGAHGPDTYQVTVESCIAVTAPPPAGISGGTKPPATRSDRSRAGTPARPTAAMPSWTRVEA